jgi:hypothetical protein
MTPARLRHGLIRSDAAACHDQFAFAPLFFLNRDDAFKAWILGPSDFPNDVDKLSLAAMTVEQGTQQLEKSGQRTFPEAFVPILDFL